MEAGRPVIIAGDVNPLPRMLEKIAAGFSARAIKAAQGMDSRAADSVMECVLEGMPVKECRRRFG